MAGNPLVGLGAVAASLLLVGYAGYSVRRYRGIADQYPTRSPPALSANETVSVRGRITEQSPTTAAPFTDQPSVLTFWAVEKSEPRARPDEETRTNWTTRLRWHERVDTFEIDTENGPVTVELPDTVEPLGSYLDLPPVPYGDWQLFVERGDATPRHVQQFLDRFHRRYDAGLGEQYEGMDPGDVLEAVRERDRYFRYSEHRLEPGDESTVYGSVVGTDPPRLRAEYVATTADRSRVRRELLKHSVLAVIFAIPLLIGGVLLAIGGV